MRLALVVLLFLSAPAHAITFRLSGAVIDTCTAYDEEGHEQIPCRVGQSFDGVVRVKGRLIDGPLVDRWLYLSPEPGLHPADQTIGHDALKVRLGFPWKGDRAAGLHFDAAGNLDKWWFTSSRFGNAVWREAAYSGIHILRPNYYATGPSGTMTRVAPAAAARVQIAQTPVPPALGLTLLGFLLMAASKIGFRSGGASLTKAVRACRLIGPTRAASCPSLTAR